jgi:hypothetical protein
MNGNDIFILRNAWSNQFGHLNPTWPGVTKWLQGMKPLNSIEDDSLRQKFDYKRGKIVYLQKDAGHAIPNRNFSID